MFRGQRVELDFGSEDEDEDRDQDEQHHEQLHPSQRQGASALPSAFVGDVLERKPAAPKPPSAPALKTKAGFPEHKKRNVESRFKQQQQQKSTASATTTPAASSIAGRHVAPPSHPLSSEPRASGGGPKTWEEEEKERIDRENRQKLADMSPQEIEETRRELMSSMSPAFLEKLLQRSNVASGSEEVDLSRAPEAEMAAQKAEKPRTRSAKTVTFEDPTNESPSRNAPTEEENATIPPPNNKEENIPDPPLPADSMHFPRPPQPPSLDPSSETFLQDLHEKYFPSLPSDPDKLEWMQSRSAATSAYDPAATAFRAGEIRFNFKGELIPPKTAAAIPVTAGLHHHGDAPDAAGYTIAELAHLARSTYPAQRCIAFQTLGRVLYRLSKGEFGDPGEFGAEVPEIARDTFGELARGLWKEVERLQVVKVLVDESEGRGVDGGRHVSAKAYATEAVWLWHKGGGRRWKAF